MKVNTQTRDLLRYPCVCAESLQSCLTLCDSMVYSPARLLCPWDSPGKNTRVGCHALLQGIFLTQGSSHISYVSCTGSWGLDHWATWKALKILQSLLIMGNRRCSKKIKLIHRVLVLENELFSLLFSAHCLVATENTPSEPRRQV